MWAVGMVVMTVGGLTVVMVLVVTRMLLAAAVQVQVTLGEL
jgi:hypothetical protein